MLSRWSVAVLLCPAVVAASAQRQPGTFKYVNTSVQTLADGTHITRTTRTVTIRDGYGRIRGENETEIQGRPMIRNINISDPVAGVSYFYQEAVGDDANVPHTYTRIEMNRSVQNPGLRVMPAPAPPATVRPPVATTGTVTGSVMAGGAVPPAQPGITQAMHPEVKNEDLGFDTVQGLSCKSHRTTQTYPVNFMGNDRPIVTTRETCMSMENGLVLRNVNEDPRTGTQTMLLEGVSLTEPPESLFQPPAGYTERPLNRPQ